MNKQAANCKTICSNFKYQKSRVTFIMSFFTSAKELFYHHLYLLYQQVNNSYSNHHKGIYENKLPYI
uniref:Uncharacterized protein n=1 Tax=Arundo donax TaxID=35708 RepID=A0A0A8XZR1_ARUDO